MLKKFIGKDVYGNKYYITNSSSSGCIRTVTFANSDHIMDPKWQMWLHGLFSNIENNHNNTQNSSRKNYYTFDEVPQEYKKDTKQYASWQP